MPRKVHISVTNFSKNKNINSHVKTLICTFLGINIKIVYIDISIILYIYGL